MKLINLYDLLTEYSPMDVLLSSERCAPDPNSFPKSFARDLMYVPLLQQTENSISGKFMDVIVKS